MEIETNNAAVRSSETQLRTLPKLLYTKREASQLLSISIRKLESLIAEKRITVRRIGRRVLIPYKSLFAFTNRDFLN